MAKVNLLLFCLSVLFFSSTCTHTEFDRNIAKGSEELIKSDVCVYTATPSGILAAIAIKNEGHSVVIVEPSKWVGGILGAGIKPIQDCPNFEAVGGRTREIIKILGMKEKRDDISAAEIRQSIRTMSPKDIREDFLDLLKENDIQIIYDHRINRCEKDGEKITYAFFDFAPFDEYGCPSEKAEKYEDLKVNAKIFIDASYDGDLMARSGISFRIGRESTLDYGEENAGVREPTNLTPIDPFIEKGNPKSGLLPLIENDYGKPLGAGDQYTQAYNFRYYVTSDTTHRVPFKKPDDYNPMDFELVGRYVEYLKESIKDEDSLIQRLNWIFPGWLNSGEYNYQRNSLITMAPVGISHLYADGDYATKARIWKIHQKYLSGLHYFLSKDPRIPEKYREKTENLGLDIRHHPETHGWPHQLYIRVSRRLIGEYTITAHDVYNRTQVDDPIGLAQYGIDTYPSRRIVLKSKDKYYVALEGKMFVGGAKGPTNKPYPIPYRAIVPQKHECTNLLIPICFSATHLGYASARMEPVFMICGESAGIAAVHAIRENKGVQDIDLENYQEHLKKLEQRLYWPVVTLKK